MAKWRWNRHAGGKQWATEFEDGAGRVKFEDGLDHASRGLARYLELDGDGCVRTKGHPLTAIKLIEQSGGIITRAAEKFRIAPEIGAGIICAESLKIKGTFERDPISERHEPGFISWSETPRRGSAGLGQTLLSTARGICERYPNDFQFVDLSSGDPREIEVGDLCIRDVSIMLLFAYLRMQADDLGEVDPVKLSGAYNAGSLKTTDKNVFRVLSYGGADRFMKQCAYANDYLAARHA
jgi:hypothetical protein